jgi:surface polysaccharide O-acyltransferase-like enzyme
MAINSQKHTEDWPEIIKAIAILMVIIIHVSAYPDYQVVNNSNWWSANILNNISRPGVPLFLMISGAFLLEPSKDENILNYFKKRVSKVLLPFIFWSCFYYIWQSASFPHNFRGWLHIAKVIIEKPTHYHLSFMYYLLELYIVVPILRSFIRGATKRDILYYIFLWIAFESIYPIIQTYLKITIGIVPELIMNYSGFMIIGYYLRVYPINISKIWLFSICLINIVIASILTYCLSTQNNWTLNEYMLDYSRINVVVYSICIFIIVRNLGTSRIPQTIMRIISVISSTTLSVYFIHPAILETLIKYKIFTFSNYGYITIPIFTICILTTCVLLTLIFRKIPIIREVWH